MTARELELVFLCGCAGLLLTALLGWLWTFVRARIAMAKNHPATANDELQHRLAGLSPCPMYVLDMDDDFKMVYVNDAACDHYGMSREALFQMRVRDWDQKFSPEMLA